MVTRKARSRNRPRSDAPLWHISAAAAFDAMEANPNARWPDRSEEENRIEPLCRPFIQAPFRVGAGAAVFTIGSCFARNVEKSLIKLGFDIPTHRFLPKGVQSTILNNFTAPSMLNEVRWALDPSATFDPETHFYRLNNGKVADLHLGGRGAYPTDAENALKRRGLITQAYKELTKAELLILTLGLSEAWYDRDLGLYLNAPPVKSLLAQFPERFEVHVLRYDRIVEDLHQLIAIARKGRGDGALKVILSVSPIPLTATFRPGMDVVQANMYSKSVLRAAAEDIAMSLPDVSYLPSYESIMLSDRQHTWEDDQTHIRQALIDLNVARMVESYVEQPDTEADISDPDLLAQLAETAMAEGDLARCDGLLARTLALSPEHPRARLISIRLKSKTADAAEFIEAVLDAYPSPADAPADIQTLLAAAFRRERRLGDAVALMEDCTRAHPQFTGGWRVLGDLYVAQKDFAKAEAAYMQCLHISKRMGLPYFKLAELYIAKEEPGTALMFARLAAALNPDNERFSDFRDALEKDANG